MFSEYAIEAECTVESKSDIEEIILATISHQMPKNIEEGTS
jgi:predicted metal-dependent HD superfamily phosphohydrolase